jgi:hypothetical protein
MVLHRPNCRRQPALVVLAALAPLSILIAGCNVIGVAANAMPEGNVPARYGDLRSHSVAVLVWVPRGLEVDYPALRLELTSGIQGRLQRAQAAGPGELKSATFPHTPASLVRFQEDHPELARTPIVNVAPRLGVQRLIYIELENFQTRSDQSVELYRGSATALLRLVEVEAGKAKVAYEESGLAVTFPPGARTEGVPNAGDARISRGTIDLLSTVIAQRFYAHPKGR